MYPAHEGNRKGERYKSKLRPTKHESPHPYYRDAVHAKVPGRGTVRMPLSCLPEPSANPYTYTCVLCTYIRIYACRDSSGPAGVLSRLLGSLASKNPICAVCVCVCVHTHIHLHTLPPALKIEKTQTIPLSFLMSKITPHAKQQVLA